MARARPDPSNAPAVAPASAPKKLRREVVFAAKPFVSSSNLSPLSVLLPRRVLLHPYASRGASPPKRKKR
jgi:hypothetical protein